MGCEVLDLNLITDDVAKDIGLLIIVGPKSPFKPQEVTKIRSFVARGGPLLVLVGNAGPSGLEELLEVVQCRDRPGARA